MYRLCSLISTQAASASLKDVACAEKGEAACGAHAAILDLAFGGDCGSAAHTTGGPPPLTGASSQPTGYPTVSVTVPWNPVSAPRHPAIYAMQMQPRGIH